MKTIDYFMVPTSPWTYMGHARLGEMAAKHGAQINIKPFDLGRVFPISGGLPLPKRAPQRQAYRLAELARWRDHLNIALTVEPKFFPAPADPAMEVIVTMLQLHGQEKAFELAGELMKAIWADEKDIADAATLATIAGKHDLNAEQLSSGAASAKKIIASNTDEAIEAQAFGSPWYRIDGHSFWGQDRLEFVEQALTA